MTHHTDPVRAAYDVRRRQGTRTGRPGETDPLRMAFPMLFGESFPSNAETWDEADPMPVVTTVDDEY